MYWHSPRFQPDAISLSLSLFTSQHSGDPPQALHPQTYKNPPLRIPTSPVPYIQHTRRLYPLVSLSLHRNPLCSLLLYILLYIQRSTHTLTTTLSRLHSTCPKTPPPLLRVPLQQRRALPQSRSSLSPVYHALFPHSLKQKAWTASPCTLLQCQHKGQQRVKQR